MSRLWVAVAGLGVLALGAGAKKPKPELDYASTPHLPAPTAGTYARVVQACPDPVVAHLLGAHPWDASLGGAAAAIAIDASEGARTSLSRWAVREVAWRAGYAYPIDEVHAWIGPKEGAPPAEVAAWLATVDAGADLALVRARGSENDVWVGMIAHPRADLGVQPRQASAGGSLILPAIPGNTYEIADPNGRLREGALDGPLQLVLGAPGEWLVEIDDAKGEVARFPVYVAMAVPDTSLLSPSTVAQEPDPEKAALQALDDVRQLYGGMPLERDPLLDEAAATAAHAADRDPREIASGLGYTKGVEALICTGASPEDCVQNLVWDPRRRAALLSTDPQLVGVSAATGTTGLVKITFLVAASTS